MKTHYFKLKLILSFLIVISLTVTKGFSQVGTEFFPIGGLSTWSTDAFTNLNFFGNIPANSPPAQIATTFSGLTNPGAGINDFTGLKLTFGAYVSSDGSKNTDVVLGSDANWGGQGIVIEINKFQIQGIRNFDYTDFSNPPKSFTATDNTAYQNGIRQDQYNTFVIDVSSTGLISITVNGLVLQDTYQADVAILKASGNRFAVFTTAVSGFQFKNLKAEKGGVTRTYFTSEFSTKYAQSTTEWTLNGSNELSYVGSVPFTTPAVVETTFGGLTATATTNDYTGLKLTFNAYISSTGANTSVVLSSNGIWGTGGKGTMIKINKTDIQGSVNFGTGTSLNTNLALYQSKVLPDAYNSITIDVATDSKITVTINGYVLPTVYQGSTLTASVPNPRYAFFATDFSGFKMKNLTAVKGGVTKTYFTNTLPVTLINFNAIKKVNGSQLNWETASEVNNSHFIVYKSADGSNFQELAKITAKNQASKYQYLDASPVYGNNYYKLVQVDLNGTSVDLGLKSLRFDLQAANTVSIYPKPADRNINISFGGTFESATTVKLFDLSGKELQKVIIASQKAPINYVLDFNNKITSGIYIISISSGKYKHAEKIMVK